MISGSPDILASLWKLGRSFCHPSLFMWMVEIEQVYKINKTQSLFLSMLSITITGVFISESVQFQEIVFCETASQQQQQHTFK